MKDIPRDWQRLSRNVACEIVDKKSRNNYANKQLRENTHVTTYFGSRNKSTTMLSVETGSLLQLREDVARPRIGKSPNHL